jgi:hypothetical protein
LYPTSQLGEDANKLYVPAGEVTFTLVDNGDGTFTLSYTVKDEGIDLPTSASTTANVTETTTDATEATTVTTTDATEATTVTTTDATEATTVTTTDATEATTETTTDATEATTVTTTDATEATTVVTTDATETTVVTDPTESTSATEATDNTEATNPTENTNPINPTDSTEATEPTSTTDPAESTAVTDATEQTTASETTEVTEATTDVTEETTASETTEVTEATTVVTEETTAPQTTETTTDAPVGPTLPAEGTFHVVAGSPELCNGASWNPADASNLMTETSTGVYEITYTNVPAGTYEFKVTTGGAWDIGDYNLTGDAKFGGTNAQITVPTDGATVKVTFAEADGFAKVYINDVQVGGATEPATTEPATTEPATTAPATTEPTTVAPTTQPATNATTATKGTEPSLQTVERYITNTNTDNGDVKGSTFSKLKLKATSSSNSKIKLTWTKVKGAKKYVIYGAKCGSTIKKIKTVSSSKKSLTITKLKKNQYYKYLVIAVNGTKTKGTSKVVHCTTKSSKYGNPTKVTVKKSTVNLKKGKTSTIKATFKYNKKVKKHVKLRYESSDTKVAKVNKNGKITAKKKGTCTIYVYAQNGVYKKVKVKVK